MTPSDADIAAKPSVPGSEGNGQTIATSGVPVERTDTGLRVRRGRVAAWLGVRASELGALGEPALAALERQREQRSSHDSELERLRRTAQRWERLASTDALTGLASRAAVEERLALEARRATRYQRPLAVLLVDIDRLKAINDTHGHAAGDTVLRAIAGRLGGALRRTDIAGRWGGDELLVICPEIGPEAAQHVADKLVALTAGEPVAAAHTRIECSVSVGWAVAGPDDAPETLLHAADEALYRAKAGGRGRASA